MKLTIIQTGGIPAPLADRFVPYPRMFETMFDAAGQGFSYETVPVFEGAPLPDPGFGHQIMADALGGDVRKSEKGWGLGRHTYGVQQRPGFMANAPASLAVACSHQDQVIVPPGEAEVILASEFTPNAGLAYRNGAALSFQPHPEFSDDYALALVELRRGKAPDEVVETALKSVAKPSDSAEVARYLSQFFKGR